ncbi:hypothetical protein FAVG1_12886 [Fusarium avenaceum]|nr:hypothetical protein FAVG1_12886 [Fusarium avenaceum]
MLSSETAITGNPAISILLGPVGDVGYVAERGKKVVKGVEKTLTSVKQPCSGADSGTSKYGSFCEKAMVDCVDEQASGGKNWCAQPGTI